ncbi:MAG TPA: hypothetical protein IAC03_01750 [Candidatus Coprenecus pullistercoris]|nr:hypothetical protein [Candidatus Coprenecus pullistercoris]
MKRHILKIAVSAVFLMFLSGNIADVSARSRTKYVFEPGDELRLTWGVAPLDAVTMGNAFSFPDCCPSQTITEEILGTGYYGGDGYLTGAVSLTYTHRFVKWFELSGILTYSGYYRDYFDKYTGKFAYKDNDNQFSLIPFVRFVWVHTNLVRLYSGIGLGLSVVTDTDRYGTDVEVLPAFAVTPIGITVGKDIYGIAELSLGNTGMFAVGLGYKF